MRKPLQKSGQSSTKKPAVSSTRSPAKANRKTTKRVKRAVGQVPTKRSPDRRLRLEWVEAGSLKANPNNWRRHPAEQSAALAAVLDDVGWAGALLFNEQTGHLIDGHARIDVVDPKQIVPVLIGKWPKAEEAKILLTLDPLARMAYADADKLQALLAQVDLSDEAFEVLLEDLNRDMASVLPAAGAEWAAEMAENPTDAQQAGYTQITFTLTDRQAVAVRQAVAAAIEGPAFGNTGNENKNGNALARICKAYKGK